MVLEYPFLTFLRFMGYLASWVKSSGDWIQETEASRKAQQPSGNMAVCPQPALAQNGIAFALSLVFWIACFYGCWFSFPRWKMTEHRWRELNTSERVCAEGEIDHTLTHNLTQPACL